jgi:hypothetical protein
MLGNAMASGLVWNGESALMAGVADLLNVWAVAKPGRKYANPYVFEALTDQWVSQDLKMWHGMLGSF